MYARKTKFPSVSGWKSALINSNLTAMAFQIRFPHSHETTCKVKLINVIIQRKLRFHIFPSDKCDYSVRCTCGSSGVQTQSKLLSSPFLLLLPPTHNEDETIIFSFFATLIAFGCQRHEISAAVVVLRAFAGKVSSCVPMAWVGVQQPASRR